MGTYPELDEQSAAYIRKIKKSPKPELPENLTINEKVARQREGYKKVAAAAGKPEPVFRVTEQTVSCADRDIPLKIYYPEDKAALPALLYFHGGGFIAGGFDTHEQMMRYFAVHAGVAIISVGYRLAPEFPYPAAVNDAFEALRWVQQNAALIKVRADRIAIGGDSAGGALAVAAMLRAKMAGTGQPVFQVLLDPTLDLTMGSASWAALGNKGYILDAAISRQYYDWYVPQGMDRTDPLISPVFVADPGGLPAAFIIIGSADPQKDEASAYAQKLSSAGIPVVYKEYAGAMHGFYQMPALFNQGKEAQQDVSGALSAALNV